jgi:selT/selW/selH-like putative selenoprotein
MILRTYRNQVSELLLRPSSGGRFEVTCNDVLIFSKAQLNRNADPEEVVEAIKSRQPITK